MTLFLSHLVVSFLSRLVETETQGLVRGSPELAARSELQSLFNLRGVDVVAVRMFFRQRLAMPRAASVAGGGMAPGEHGKGGIIHILLLLKKSCTLKGQDF